MTITATPENLYYLGFGKQSGWGTPVTPTKFWRWLDGTDTNPTSKIITALEGDTTPFETLIYKTEQYWIITIKEYARPITLGYCLQALLGSGSDAYTAPTQTTTLSASILAGATSFSTATSIGSNGTMAVNVTPAYNSTTYEVINVNLASRSGVGPYTYTLANNASFKNAHASGDTVTNISTHSLTRQSTTYDPYTIEVAFSQAGIGKAFRIQDCVCTEVKTISEAGKPVMLEHIWYGSLATQQAGLLTPIFEGTSVIGAAGSTFMHYQASGNWLLNTLGTGNAATIHTMELILKNSTIPTEMLAESLNPTYFLPGYISISGKILAIFQTYDEYLQTYFGSADAGTGSADSYIIGTGTLSTKWLTDLINALSIQLYINYTASKLIPKLDAKPLTQPIVFTALATKINPIPFTATLTNSQASAY